MSEVHGVIKAYFETVGMGGVEYNTFSKIHRLKAGISNAQIQLPSNGFYLILAGEFPQGVTIEAHNFIFDFDSRFDVQQSTIWAIPILSGQVCITCSTVSSPVDTPVTILEIKPKKNKSNE